MNYRAFRASLVESQEPKTEPETHVIGIREEMYSLIPEAAVVELIRKHHPDIKITNTLIESYRGAAKSRELTSDQTVLELREINPADSVFEGHIEFALKSGEVVVISEKTQKQLNKILGHHQDIIDHMSESAETFMDVINLLEE